MIICHTILSNFNINFNSFRHLILILLFILIIKYFPLLIIHIFIYPLESNFLIIMNFLNYYDYFLVIMNFLNYYDYFLVIMNFLNCYDYFLIIVNFLNCYDYFLIIMNFFNY